MSCVFGEEYIIVPFVTGLTRSAALQILDDLPERIIAVEGARLVQRHPKRLGDRACYRADELAVALAVQEPGVDTKLEYSWRVWWTLHEKHEDKVALSRLTLRSGACIARGRSQ